MANPFRRFCLPSSVSSPRVGMRPRSPCSGYGTRFGSSKKRFRFSKPRCAAIWCTSRMCWSIVVVLPTLRPRRCAVMPRGTRLLTESMVHVKMPSGMISGTRSPVEILRRRHGTNPSVKK